MLGTTYYHNSVRKLVIALGTLFNNVHIQRRKNGFCTTTEDGLTITSESEVFDTKDVGKSITIQGVDVGEENLVTTIESYVDKTSVVLTDPAFRAKENAKFHITDNTLKVPLSYAPREKFLRRVEEHPDLDNVKTQIVLPRMSFELVDMVYDPNRKLNTLQKYFEIDHSDYGNLRYEYQRVPYNFDFNVYIYTRNLDDAYQIMEQVVPYFTPEFVVSINDTDDMKIVTDIPFTLKSVSQSDQYEGNFEETRTIIIQLKITAKGYLYGPTKHAKIIKKAIADFYTGGWNGEVIEDAKRESRVTVEPPILEVEDGTLFEAGEWIFAYKDKDGNVITSKYEDSKRKAKIMQIDGNNLHLKTESKFKPNETVKGIKNNNTSIVQTWTDGVSVEIFNDAKRLNLETGEDE